MSKPMQPVKKHLACLVAAAAWLSLAAPAPAQEGRGEPPTVIELEPLVEKLVGEDPRELHPDDELEYGDEVRTGPGAWASIALGPGGILDIGSDTTIVLREESDELQVELERGRLIVALARAFRGVFRVNAPSVALGLRGTLIDVLVLHDGTTRLWVYEGEVTLEGLDVTVQQGSQVLIKPDGKALPPSPISLWEPSTLLQAPESTAPGDPVLLDRIDPRLFIRDF